MLVHVCLAICSIWFKAAVLYRMLDKDTLNISIEDLKKAYKKTKAIVLINVLGNCSNLFEIKKNCQKKILS